jgi:hypothetical protein
MKKRSEKKGTLMENFPITLLFPIASRVKTPIII